MRASEPSPEDRERLVLILGLCAAIGIVLAFGLFRLFRSEASWLPASDSTYTLDGRAVPMPEEWRPARSYDVEPRGIDGGALDAGTRTALYVEFPGLHEDELADRASRALARRWEEFLREGGYDVHAKRSGLRATTLFSVTGISERGSVQVDVEAWRHRLVVTWQK